jgi:hypothetical protein
LTSTIVLPGLPLFIITIITPSSPLHVACTHGAVGVVSELLAAGAQIEPRDVVSELGSMRVCLNDSLSLQAGSTPLHLACFIYIAS